MIFFLIEVLIITILAMIFSTLIFDERRNRLNSMRTVKLKGYWNGDERRSVDRLNMDLEVKYFINGTASYGKSADISTRGIRLILDEKIDKNTPLRLEIKLPDRKQILKVKGEVVWAAESPKDERNSMKRLFNTGIKFARFQNDNETKLFNFIRDLEKQKN